LKEHCIEASDSLRNTRSKRLKMTARWMQSSKIEPTLLENFARVKDWKVPAEDVEVRHTGKGN